MINSISNSSITPTSLDSDSCASQSDASQPGIVRPKPGIHSPVLEKVLPDSKNLLELGSGKGHHACFFGPKFPQLTWQTSDRPEYHDALHETITNANSPANILRPIRLDIETDPIDAGKYDTLFGSNLLNCMSIENVETLIQKASAAGIALLIFYGPFNLIEGSYANPWNNGDGNYKFDATLKMKIQALGLKM